jgi:Protein of unknown function (DUF4245)
MMGGMAKKEGSRRLRTTVRDMILSMTLIVLPILAVFWLMPSTASSTPVSVVSAGEYQAMLSAARANLPFTALSPTGLSAGWQLTSDEYEPSGGSAADWHLGYLTPSGKYAVLEQTTESIGQFLDGESSDATQSGTVQVAGSSWQEYTGTSPAALGTLLFREDTTKDGTSLEVVAGSAPMSELRTLASSLQS